MGRVSHRMEELESKLTTANRKISWLTAALFTAALFLGLAVCGLISAVRGNEITASIANETYFTEILGLHAKMEATVQPGHRAASPAGQVISSMNKSACAENAPQGSIRQTARLGSRGCACTRRRIHREGKRVGSFLELIFRYAPRLSLIL